MKYQPIIIVGAGRSGTNMLRDSLCSMNGFETWPCDEINYIWRHGNIRHPSDRFTELEARTEVKQFIVRSFEKLEKVSKASYVVEKTCANSLKSAFHQYRIPASQIHFHRQGRKRRGLLRYAPMESFTRTQVHFKKGQVCAAG